MYLQLYLQPAGLARILNVGSQLIVLNWLIYTARLALFLTVGAFSLTAATSRSLLALVKQVELLAKLLAFLENDVDL
jgi:hypothetical protein